jgi:hypothetical protein
MDESKLSGRIDLTARVGAMVLATVYGSGFVIVTLYQARFGVSAFDLLKPKIFAAGFTFVALVFLVSLAAFRFFGVGWWQSGPQHARKPMEAWLDVISKGLLFFMLCEIAGWNFSFLFDRPLFDSVSPEATVWMFVSLFGAIAIVVVAVLVEWLIGFERFWRLFPGGLILSIGSAGGGFAIARSMLISRDRTAWWFSVWIFGSGIGSVFLYRALRSTENIIRTEWERMVPIALSVVSIYAYAVYPHIRGEWGGGVPAQVIVYFNMQQPLFAGQILETNLLEENEHGYYVTPALDGPRAYFIPRESVALVKFERR